MDRKKQKKMPVFLFGLVFLFAFLAVLTWFFMLRPDPNLWRKDGRVNILINSTPILLLSFNLSDESLSVLSLSPRIYLDATEGYGNYLLGKIPQLDQLERKNGELIINSVREFLGVNIDGYIDLGEKEFSKKDKFTREEFLQIKEEIINWEAVFKSSSGVGKFHTSLTFPNLLASYLKFKKITGGKLQFVDLFSTNLLTQDRQSDGSLVLTAQPEVLDNELHNVFNEEGIVRERLKSEILNSTDEPGLAEKAARIVTNLGIQVINTGNFKEPLSHCQIYTNKVNIHSYTVKRLSAIFRCQTKNTVLPDSRADLSIVIGKEYQKRLMGDDGR